MKLNNNVEYQLVIAKRNRGGIVGRGKLKGRKILTKTQFFVKKGDLLISRRQIIHGACGIIPEHLDGAIVSNEYSTLLPKSSLLEDFIKHYCHTVYFQKTCFQSSIGVDVEKMIFKIDDWLQYKFNLPPLPEQKKIAEILTTVDDKISSIEDRIQRTEQLKKGLMEKLLTEGIGHTEFKDTEIGRMPASWDTAEIGTIAIKIIGGGTPSRERPYFYKGSIPWLTVKDLSFNRFYIYDTMEHITNDAVQNSSANLIPKDNVIVSTRMALGKALINKVDMAINQDMKALFLNKSASKNEFFLYWYLSKSKQIEKMGSGTTVKGISLNALKGLTLPLPPIPEQKQIANILSAVDDKLDILQSKKNSYETLKKGLREQLLTGKRRVKI